LTVLLCTGNYARSILAEALFTKISKGKLIDYFVVSHPKRRIHPIAEVLAIEMNYPKEKLRSKG
jgi:arsenate reductase